MYRDGTYMERGHIGKRGVGTNTEMGHIQRGETHGVGTHMEWGSGDTYGDGIYTKRGLTRSGNTHGVGE